MRYTAPLINLSLVSGFAPSWKKSYRELTDVKLKATTETKNFVRLRPHKARGNCQNFELQTAITILERPDPSGQVQTVELHAQIHFGTEEYFEYYNSLSSVCYELLVDECFLQTDADGVRKLRSNKDGSNVLMASPTDQQTANQYGLTCQVDVVHYAKPDWIHADLSRQEFLQLIQATPDSQQPLWALASTAPSWPGAEAVSAIFRPSTPSLPLSTPVSKKLFSNLFLSGSNLATVLRLLFWVLVPSPELSVMLLDWSSILPRPTGGISQVAVPVLESLLSGNLQEARQLIFGQMLVSGQRGHGNDELLIQKRNAYAVEVLQQTKADRVCLLYGAMHCPDLISKLQAEGFRPTQTTWRTAWSVRVPTFGVSESQQGGLQHFASLATPNALAVSLVILPFYFLLGGLDWIGTLQASMHEHNILDALIVEILYLVRHVALYLGLAKFVVEWDSGTNLFDGR